MRWALVRNENPGVVVKSKKSGLLTFQSALASQHYVALVYQDCPFFSFGTETTSLLVNGSLSGNFTVAVVVTKVIFTDGTIWTADEPNGNEAAAASTTSPPPASNSSSSGSAAVVAAVIVPL